MRMNHHGEWDLNNDVMIEILSCLPLKSLARFKTVNKTWYEIISSRQLARRHREKKMSEDNRPWGLLIKRRNVSVDKGLLSISSSKHHYGIFFTVEGGFGELIRRYFKHSAPIIVGPLDGLICIYEDICIYDNDVPWRRTIALCNPYLRGKVEMIPPPPLSSFPSACKLGFGYDSVTSDYRASCNLGFGYDSVTRDYRIVMVFSYKSHSHIVLVYTRATNSWKELDCNALSRDISIIIRPIAPYQDGSFAHWHAWLRHSTTGLYEWVVLSFDMRNEVFKVTPLPPCFPGVQHVKSVATEEVRVWSMGIGIRAMEDSLALDYSPPKEFGRNKMWLISRWKSKKLGGDECWVPLTPPQVEIYLSRGEGTLIGNHHGLISQFIGISGDVKLYYLYPQGALATTVIFKRYFEGRIDHIYLYEPSLIDLKDDPINNPVGWVGSAIAAVGGFSAVAGAVAAAIGVAAIGGAAAARCRPAS